jgi:flavin-dependent dehydrogenase
VPDLLIIGAGPAGCAAAIQAARTRLDVVLVEARERRYRSPGETLHPGIDPLFERLGILDAVRAENFHRHGGIWIEWDGNRRFEAYGEDKNHVWLGYQVDRGRLQAILLNAAKRAGVKIEIGRAAAPIMAGNRLLGVMVDGREVRAAWTGDATGRRAFLARALGLIPCFASPTLRVQFGWHEKDVPELNGEPEIVAVRNGWTWRAPLAGKRTAWAALTVRPASSSLEARPGVDLSWRHFSAAAGPGYFLLGDAAAILDPASSHGVLRAVMTGMLCSHLVAKHARRRISEAETIASYRNWVDEQFNADVQALRALYMLHPHRTIADLFGASPLGVPALY